MRRQFSVLLLLSICALLGIFVTGASAAVVSADAGGLNSCYLDDEGDVYCWGLGIGYQNDTNDFTPGISTTVPTKVDDLSAVTKVDVGSTLACAIDAGAAKCWGSNSDGQLGDGTDLDSPDPVQVSGLSSGITDIAAGDRYACAVSSGALECWGGGNLATTPLPPGTGNTPTTYPGLESGVTAVSTGHWGERLCVVQSGAVKCAGDNLWDGPGQIPKSMTAVPGLSTGFTAVSAGYGINCALKAGGVWCWNSNSLGIGPNPGSVGPQQPIGLTSGVLDVQTSDHGGACAIVTGGEVKCFGRNPLIDGANVDTLIATTTEVLSGATALSIDSHPRCVVLAGELSCNGIGFTGQLGDGASFFTNEPTDVIGSNAADATAGESVHCAVIEGAGKCWGQPSAIGLPQVSDGTGAGPITIPGLESNVTQITPTEGGGCAIVSGAVKCWGENSQRQLGFLGDDSATAVVVPGLSSGATKVDGFEARRCALVSGAIRCWGNSSLELTTAIESGVTDFDLSSGGPLFDGFGCAVIAAAAKCWQLGGNSSFDDYLGVGDGSTTGFGPFQVLGLTSGVTKISAGGNFACALVAGDVKCWGQGTNGQLGNGAIEHRPMPVEVGGLDNVSSIDVGSDSACAITASALKCWGANDHGQLGDKTLEDSSIPVSPHGMASGVSDVSVGTKTACAIQSAVAKCWGANANLVLPSLSKPLRRQTMLPVSAGVDPPPRATILEPVDGDLTADTTPEFDFDVNHGASAQCKIDEAEYNDCPVGELPEFEDGLHSIRVRATQLDGQIGNDVVKFEIDTTPPVIDIASPAHGSVQTEPQPPLWVFFNEELSAVYCTINGVPIHGGDCTNTSILGGLDIGVHTIVITAADLVGNASTAVSIFTRANPVPDPPVVPPTSNPPVLPPPRPAKPTAFKATVGRGGKPKRGKIKYTVRVSFTPAAASASDCSGPAFAEMTFRRRTLTTEGSQTLTNGSCVGKYMLRVPASWKGKTISLRAEYAGNLKQLGFRRNSRVRLR